MEDIKDEGESLTFTLNNSEEYREKKLEIHIMLLKGEQLMLISVVLIF